MIVSWPCGDGWFKHRSEKSFRRPFFTCFSDDGWRLKRTKYSHHCHHSCHILPHLSFPPVLLSKCSQDIDAHCHLADVVFTIANTQDLQTSLHYNSCYNCRTQRSHLKQRNPRVLEVLSFQSPIFFPDFHQAMQIFTPFSAGCHG